MDYFQQAQADSVPFSAMVERYGVVGMIEALQNYVNKMHPTSRTCSNRCSLSFNVACELSKTAAAIRKWNEEQ